MVNKQISSGHRNFVICGYNSSVLFVLHKGASRNLQVNYLLQQLALRTLSNPLFHQLMLNAINPSCACQVANFD